MTKIYDTTDRIKVKIDDVTITISPLTVSQKTEVQVLMAQGRIERDFSKMQSGVIKTLKYGLKDIDGLQKSNGAPYKLSFDESGLTDNCIDSLFNIELHKKLVKVCQCLTVAITGEFTDENGKPIEGVELVSVTPGETPNPNQ